MKIDAKPCNMTPGGNNIFPRFLINVKEACGIFLITVWSANKLAQIVRSDTILHPELREDNYGKICYGNNIFKKKYILHAPLHPFQEAIVDGGRKLTQINNTKTRVKSTFVFFFHVKSNL